jgi:peroxiredoxin
VIGGKFRKVAFLNPGGRGAERVGRGGVLGLVLDGSGFGLGKRSKRYAAVIEDGVVRSIDVDESGIDLSTCSDILLKL